MNDKSKYLSEILMILVSKNRYRIIVYSAYILLSDISDESKAQCLHFLVVYIVFLYFIFKIGAGADNVWVQMHTFIPRKMSLFVMGDLSL